MGPDLACTCAVDPYRCPVGEKLVDAIHERKRLGK